jgi:hypothetical protein
MNFFQHAIPLTLYSRVEKYILKDRREGNLFKMRIYFFVSVGPFWGWEVGRGTRAPRGRQLYERMVKNGSLRLFVF